MPLIRRLWQSVLRHRTDVDVIVPALAAIATGILTAWVIRRHVIVNYDSIYYLSSAENLANGLGLMDYTGGDMTNFPPGYPLVIRLVMLFGADTVTAARVLQVLASMAIVGTVAIIARRLGPRGSAAIASVLVATVPAFLAMNVQIMSESLFAVAMLILIIAVMRLPDPPARLGVRTLAFAIGASWICVLLRYQGYAVVAATAVILLVRPGTWTDRVRGAAIYSIGAGAMILGIVIQSRIRTGSLGAPISAPKGTFIDDVNAAFGYAGRWIDYVPTWFPTMSHELAGFLTVAVGATSLVTIVWRRRTPTLLQAAVSYAIYAVTIIGVTLVSGRRVWVEITPRMAFALLPLIVILVAVVFAQSVSRGKLSLRWSTATVLVIVLVIGTIQTLSGAQRVREATRGGASLEEQVPELGRAVAALADDAIVYSNNPEGIWYSSRRPVVHRLSTWTNLVVNLTDPNLRARIPADIQEQLVVFRDHLCHGFYLAWTDWQHESRPANSLDNVDVFTDLTDVGAVDGGTLYFVESNIEQLCVDAKEVSS